jgi:hypothetical protein
MPKKVAHSSAQLALGLIKHENMPHPLGLLADRRILAKWHETEG